MDIRIQTAPNVYRKKELFALIHKSGQLLCWEGYACLCLVKSNVCVVLVFSNLTTEGFQPVMTDVYTPVDINDVPNEIHSILGEHINSDICDPEIEYKVYGSCLEVVAVATPPPLITSDKNEKIKAVLSQCSEIINELSQDLSIAQTECYPLHHYVGGSQYKTRRVRQQLIEQGLIIQVDKGYVFTELGLELRLGTNTRTSDSTYQILRYSPAVSQYIDEYKGGIRDKRISNIRFKSPTGEIHTVSGIPTFAKAHGLQRGKLYMMLKGTVKHHNGWTLA